VVGRSNQASLARGNEKDKPKGFHYRHEYDCEELRRGTQKFPRPNSIMQIENELEPPEELYWILQVLELIPKLVTSSSLQAQKFSQGISISSLQQKARANFSHLALRSGRETVAASSWP
jgi:hypothetical protein